LLQSVDSAQATEPWKRILLHGNSHKLVSDVSEVSLVRNSFLNWFKLQQHRLPSRHEWMVLAILNLTTDAGNARTRNGPVMHGVG
jgi:hypothetical protein